MNNLANPRNLLNLQIMVGEFIQRAKPNQMRRVLNTVQLPNVQKRNIESAWLSHIIKNGNTSKMFIALQHTLFPEHHSILFRAWIAKLIESGNVRELHVAFTRHIPRIQEDYFLHLENATRRNNKLQIAKLRRSIAQLNNYAKALGNAWAIRKSKTAPIKIVRKPNFG